MPIGKGKGLGFQRGGVDPAIALINDGNTVAWYDYLTTSTITKDGSNYVSNWADKLGSSNALKSDLLPPAFPIIGATGVTFSGVNGCGLRTAEIATLIQPCTFYFVLRQVTWTANDFIFSGRLADRGVFQNTASPNLALYAGAVLNNTTPTLGVFQILTVIYNGANSLVQINDLTAATGNGGTVSPAGLTMGSNGAADFTSFVAAANVIYKGGILRIGADGAANRTIIKTYLKTLYGL